MPGLYYSDEEHMSHWLSISKTDEGVSEYMEKYVLSVDDFSDYINLIGGQEKMDYLRRIELLQTPLRVPWARRG